MRCRRVAGAIDRQSGKVAAQSALRLSNGASRRNRSVCVTLAGGRAATSRAEPWLASKRPGLLRERCANQRGLEKVSQKRSELRGVHVVERWLRYCLGR